MLKRSAAPRPFCVALNPSVHWHASFLYCCTLYNFSFLDFVSGDLALTEWEILTRPSNFHCFGELEPWPWPALAHLCTWAEIIGSVEPLSWLTARSVASLFFYFSKKTENLVTDFFKAHAQDCLWAKVTKDFWPLFFLEIVENTWKQWPAVSEPMLIGKMSTQAGANHDAD